MSTLKYSAAAHSQSKRSLASRLVPEPGLNDAATLIRLPVIAAELDDVPHGTELHVDFEYLDFVDHACLELLMNWASQHEKTGGELIIDWESLHARFHSAAKRNGFSQRIQDSRSPKNSSVANLSIGVQTQSGNWQLATVN